MLKDSWARALAFHPVCSSQDLTHCWGLATWDFRFNCVCHGVPCANRQLLKFIKSGIEVDGVVKFELILCQHSEFQEEAHECWWLGWLTTACEECFCNKYIWETVLVEAHFTRNWRWRNGCVAEKCITEFLTNICVLLASDLQPDLGMCWVSMCNNTVIIRKRAEHGNSPHGYFQ